MFVTSISNVPPHLSPPCLTTVSKVCCRKPLHHRPLRTPVFHSLASHSSSASCAHLENIWGVYPMTTINHTSIRTRSLRSARLTASAPLFAPFWHDHAGAQDSCAPGCPGVNLSAIPLFLRIPFHFFSLPFLSPVVDFRPVEGTHT